MTYGEFPHPANLLRNGELCAVRHFKVMHYENPWDRVIPRQCYNSNRKPFADGFDDCIDLIRRAGPLNATGGDERLLLDQLMQCINLEETQGGYKAESGYFGDMARAYFKTLLR